MVRPIKTQTPALPLNKVFSFINDAALIEQTGKLHECTSPSENTSQTMAYYTVEQHSELTNNFPKEQ